MVLTAKAMLPIVCTNGKLALVKALLTYQKSKTHECKKCNKIILYWSIRKIMTIGRLLWKEFAHVLVVIPMIHSKTTTYLTTKCTRKGNNKTTKKMSKRIIIIATHKLQNNAQLDIWYYLGYNQFGMHSFHCLSCLMLLLHTCQTRHT